MEFRELLQRRRMVRHYTGEPMQRETIERIVATVRRAPSAGYSQGQRLLVITDRELRRTIAERAGEPERVEQGFEPWLASAPVHVLVCTREADYHERYRKEDKLTEEGGEIEWPVPFWIMDAGAAAMLILLAAIDEGLGAGLFGVFGDEADALRELLGIPDDVTIVAYITLGYAAPDPAWSRTTSRATQRRKPLDELVYWERWGAGDGAASASPSVTSG